MERQVNEVIDTIRPIVVADGGDVELVGVDHGTGVVTVRLSGACVSCPSSTNAMRAGIERIVMDHVPEVSAVLEGDAGPRYADTPVAL